PGEGQPGIVAGDPCRIGAGSDRYAQLKHFPNRRGALRSFVPVALQEILALKRNPILDSDAAAQSFDAFEVAIRDGFAMIQEPARSSEGDFTVYGLIDIQYAGDAFVVGRVNAKGPFVGGQQRYDILEVGLEGGREVWTCFHEILEVRGGVNEHFPGPVAAVEVVALA